MTDDHKPYAIIAEGLRLALLVDVVISQTPLDLTTALELRNDLYDFLQSLEGLPDSESTRGLNSLVATTFRSLQGRLTHPPVQT